MTSLPIQEVPVPRDLTPAGAYCLRVAGDAMADFGILSGDVVIVKPGPVCADGDIVAVLIGDEIRVRKVEVDAGDTFFNSRDQTTSADRPGVRVMGRVIGLMRSY